MNGGRRGVTNARKTVKLIALDITASIVRVTTIAGAVGMVLIRAATVIIAAARVHSVSVIVTITDAENMKRNLPLLTV
ncbi:MAG: hypothetical protein NVSMB56_04240 [Pyrinomonadaceae bacterium]